MKIHRSGEWLHGEATVLAVDIVSLGFDFWYAVAESDDQLEEGEVPKPLNDEGVLFYYRFKHAGSLTTPTWPDSPGFQSLEEAVKAAQQHAPTLIRWKS